MASRLQMPSGGPAVSYLSSTRGNRLPAGNVTVWNPSAAGRKDRVASSRVDVERSQFTSCGQSQLKFRAASTLQQESSHMGRSTGLEILRGDFALPGPNRRRTNALRCTIDDDPRIARRVVLIGGHGCWTTVGRGRLSMESAGRSWPGSTDACHPTSESSVVPRETPPRGAWPRKP